MDSYDPDQTPDTESWLSLDEGERMILVEDYHREHGNYGESLEMHSVLHCIVENRLAEDAPEVRDALARLQKQGLSRHDAIHGIGSVVTEFMFSLMNAAGKGAPPDQRAYHRKLAKFNAKDWYKLR